MGQLQSALPDMNLSAFDSIRTGGREENRNYDVVRTVPLRLCSATGRKIYGFYFRIYTGTTKNQSLRFRSWETLISIERDHNFRFRAILELLSSRIYE